ncbi:T9SS type A sorting domain-containing protein, partial [bacterium]|nr:T9SS type A sorting domain-containing protein [bacterium]
VLYLNPSGTPPASTSIVDIDGNDISTMRVYPNPATYASTLSFGMAEAGNVIVNICDISGKAVSNFATNLTAGTYKFKLPALRSGIYFVTVVQNGKKQTEKLVSINNSVGTYNLIQNVEKIEIAETKSAPQKVKEATAATDGMAFIEGNLLRYTAMSGRCKTIVMDSPSKSKNIDILFKECIDGDNNAYPIVKIGTLYWMAENLKTTKKANGTPLAKVTGAAWAGLTSTSDAYCYFGDQDANAANFGALYTHHAAKTDLAPLGGWRLPTKKEFTTMAGYLEGKENAGAKLKKAETTKWTIDNRFATNLSGFSATASGMKVGSAFSEAGKEAAFWNSDETKPTEASFAKLTSALDSISLYGDTLRAAEIGRAS